MTAAWPWLVLFALGAYHGVNPGMGWLFAVSLGLQEKSRKAVLRALGPIALGHALSIGVVVLVVALLRAGLQPWPMRVLCAAVLFSVGLYRFVRTRHPGWVGMKVNFRDLVAWSFIMASAHGAGLMLVPVLLSNAGAAPAPHHHHPGMKMDMAAMPPGEHAEHLRQAFGGASPLLATPLGLLAAVLVHTLGHLVVSAAIALLVYEKLGLSILRQAWFNLNLLWTIALMVTGVLVLLV